MQVLQVMILRQKKPILDVEAFLPVIVNKSFQKISSLPFMILKLGEKDQ